MSLDKRGMQNNVGSEGDNNGNEITMYTTNWCPACWRAKQVLESLQVSYREIDINDDEDAAEQVMRINNGYRSVPTIVFPDGSVLTEPYPPVLVEKLQPYV